MADTPRRRAVALVTYRGLPNLSDDDRLLIPALERHGIDAVPVVWSDPAVEWRRFTAAVVRSTWDYYLHLPDFLGWIERLEAIGTPLWNPPAVLRWNCDKRYLRELKDGDVAVVPTRWIEPGDGTSLASLLEDAGWDQAVVKPAVSASGWETWKTSRSLARRHETRFRRLLARGTVMLQPFIATIASEGEWSLLYIGGEYSHSVVKRARPGDFRVQPRHGGRVVANEPDADIRRQADAVLRAALIDPAGALYARVDGCVSNGDFLLMELELLEPSLYLGTAPRACERLASTLAAALR